MDETNSQGSASAFKKAKKKLFKLLGRKVDDDVDHAALLMAQMPEEIRNRKPVITTVLVALSLLMSAVLLIKTGSLDPEAPVFIQYGANCPVYTFRGQLWRLFTDSFLHFGFKHLVFNMACLWSIGCFLEKLIGHGKLFCVYFLTALTGSLMSSAFHPEDVCAGASGAVFGLFGSCVVYLAFRAKELKFEVDNLVGYMGNGLLFLAVNFFYSMFPGVDMSGHVGGFLGGLAVGAVLAVPHRWKGLPHAEWYHRGVSLATCALGAILLISWFAAGDAPRLDVKDLSVEVGNLIKEKMTEGIKDLGMKRVNVQIKECILFHDGGNDYHGLVSMKCEYDGETENLTKSIKVTYDGEQVMYQMEN